MQTIVLATQKGGSGKSTLAIGLALAAIQAGHSVRLIETDSQGTLSNWQARRIYAEPIVEPVYSAGEIEQRLQSLERDGVMLTIVDTLRKRLRPRSELSRVLPGRRQRAPSPPGEAGARRRAAGQAAVMVVIPAPICRSHPVRLESPSASAARLSWAGLSPRS